MPSSASSNLDLNLKSTTSLKNLSHPPTPSPGLSAKNGNATFTPTKISFEGRSGEAKEWVRGVGEGEDPEKEWVKLMERVIKRGFFKSNTTPSASTSNADGASKTASLLDMPEEVLVPRALYWITLQLQVNDERRKRRVRIKRRGEELPLAYYQNDIWLHKH
jgi:hypothetical protein